MAYATVAQMLLQFDSREVGQLVADDNTQVAAASLTANSVLLQALEAATGEILSAALVGNKYSKTEMDALAASSDAFLAKLTCDLAMGYLLNRRSLGEKPLPPAIEESRRWINLCRLGERIFRIEDNQDAGNTELVILTGQTRSEVNLAANKSRFFPTSCGSGGTGGGSCGCN